MCSWFIFLWFSTFLTCCRVKLFRKPVLKLNVTTELHKWLWGDLSSVSKSTRWDLLGKMLSSFYPHVYTTYWEFHLPPHMHADTALSLCPANIHIHMKSKLPKVFYERGLCFDFIFHQSLTQWTQASTHGNKYARNLKLKIHPKTWFCNMIPFIDPCRKMIFSLFLLQTDMRGQPQKLVVKCLAHWLRLCNHTLSPMRADIE